MSIAYVNSTGAETTSASSLSFQHEVASGSNRLLVVNIQLDGTSGSTVSSVTFNGDNLTQVAATGSGNIRSEMWYLLNPDVDNSANNLVITANQSTVLIIAVATNYTGVKQTGQPDTSTSGYDLSGTSGTSKTVNVTTTADNCWLMLLGYATSSNVGASTGATERAEPPTYTRLGYFDSNADKTPAGSHSIAFNFLNNDNITWICAAFAPVVAVTFDVSDGVKVGDTLSQFGKLLTFNLTDGVKVGDALSAIRARLFSVIDGVKVGDIITKFLDLWTQQSKNTANWTGGTKSSSASYTNESKSSSNWTAQDKS